eukprot:4491014-Amphidinium_carterae.1
MAAAVPVCPPDPIPSEFQNDIALLDADLRAMFGALSSPYHCQATFAQGGFKTVADLADRWPSKTEARTSAPEDLGFKVGQNNHTAVTSLLVSVRIGQAIDQALERVKQKQTLVSSTSDSNAKYILTSAVRASMESLYTRKYHHKPSLELQGSDPFLGKLYKDVAKGGLSFYPLNKIQPYLVDVDPAPRASKKKRTDDSDLEYEEDPPSSWEAWRSRLSVWRTSLLMCLVSHPHHIHLQLELDVLDRFYTFLDGPEIARRVPPPSLQVMMRAERTAWRKISIYLHEGSSLTEAIGKIQTDTLFWVREVYEHIRVMPQSVHPQSKRPRQTSPANYMPQKNASKGKGKQKSKLDTSKWATHDLAGNEICRNFHFG